MISLAGWIGIGAAGGLATGLFVGEAVSVLKPLGKAYVMLLESVVYPYLISSLLHGLGRLSPRMALRLLKKSWPFYLVAWVGTLGLIHILSQAFPAAPPPLVVDSADPARMEPDFLQLILPGNIFHDLAANYVPAVVMLSVLFGVAIQGISGKEKILDILAMLRTACVKIWNWVVMLAPVAVFAMFAVTAGTTELAKAGGLAAYVGLFLLACGLLAFFAIPALISAIIPVRYREVILELRNALTLALVTTLSVVALPYIQRAAEKLVRANGIEDGESSEIIETCLAVNYPFGQLGNFFVYFFILFTAFYTRTSLTGGEQAVLPLMTLFSSFGSPTSTVNAVDFLSSWLQLPGRPTDLYVETMMVTRYGQVALSVMGFAFLTFLMTFSYYGRIKIRSGRVVAAIGLTAALTAGLAWGGHALFADVLKRPQDTYLSLELKPWTTRDVQVRYFESRAAYLGEFPDSGLKPNESVLSRIQRTGKLRVGYGREIAPFAYTNVHGNLVGYDVACAFDMARALNVDLYFVPVVYNKVERDVKDGLLDLWLGGVYVMESRMLWGAFSDPYYQSPMALIVPSDTIGRVMTMADIKADPEFTIALMNNPILHTLRTRLFPGVKYVTVKSYEDLPRRSDWSAALWTLEQSGVWASGHPGYSAVRPRNLSAVMVFAYLMPRRSLQMRQFVNHWLAMRKADGFLEYQRAYWMEGALIGGLRRR